MVESDAPQLLRNVVDAILRAYALDVPRKNAMRSQVVGASKRRSAGDGMPILFGCLDGQRVSGYWCPVTKI